MQVICSADGLSETLILPCYFQHTEASAGNFMLCISIIYGFRFAADKADKKKEENIQLEEFKHDFRSRIWLTYRTEFQTLPGSHLRSDIGWGCMLRCGQMLMAQALLVHILGRGNLKLIIHFVNIA